MKVVTRKGGRFARVKSLSGLLEAQWIVLGAPQGPSHLYVQAFEANGLRAPKASTMSDSLMATMGIIENTDICCALPERLIEFFAQRHSVVALDIREPLPELTIALMTRAGIPLTPAAAQLARFIRQCSDTLVRTKT